MAFASDARLLVLHAIRVKGFVTDDAVAKTTGLPLPQVAVELRELADAGAASFREGRMVGWSITGEGRAQHAKLIAEELDAAGARPDVDAAYRDFLAVNSDLLGVCTRWQLRTGPDGKQQLNQHDDPDYDAAVIADLHDVDDVIQPVCARLAACLARFGGYGARLAAALARMDAGEIEWLTKPLIDSYHTVWFELHEDLLTTLGIERSKEEP